MLAIEQHYKAIEEIAPLFDIGHDSYFNLLELGEKYSNARFVIDRPRRAHMEGEIALSLYYRDIRIHTVMFTIAGEGPVDIL